MRESVMYVEICVNYSLERQMMIPGFWEKTVEMPFAV